MTTCQNCRRVVAVEAPACPRCGAPAPGERHADRDTAAAPPQSTQDVDRATAMIGGAIVLLFLLLLVIGHLRNLA
jgi:predicted amidophosphoribosyltransferase